MEPFTGEAGRLFTADKFSTIYRRGLLGRGFRFWFRREKSTSR